MRLQMRQRWRQLRRRRTTRTQYALRQVCEARHGSVTHSDPTTRRERPPRRGRRRRVTKREVGPVVLEGVVG